MSETLAIGVVKKSGDILPRLREAWSWEGMQLEKGGKKTTKAGLISKGRLQTEGFLTSCLLICCSVRRIQGFLLRHQLLLTLWDTVSIWPSYLQGRLGRQIIQLGTFQRKKFYRQLKVSTRTHTYHHHHHTHTHTHTHAHTHIHTR